MKRSAHHTTVTDRLAALSEPVRLRICRLLDQEELSVGEIASVVQLPQSTVSRHLKVLAGAGLITGRAERTATMYQMRLDDLEPGARALWLAVRDEMREDRAVLEEDGRRLRSVLAERRTDSRAFFGRVAGEWDEVRAELFGRGFTTRALLALLPREWTVADLGCGTGNASETLAPFVKRVIAVDRSEPMLEAARKRLSGAENVEFRVGELESLPLEDDSVDAAVCVLVLHYLEDPVGALREMRRVVRPGGAVMLVDMYEHGRELLRNTMGHAHLGFSDERLRELVGEAGLGGPVVSPLPALPEATGPGLFVAVAPVLGVNGSGGDVGRGS